MPMLLRISNGRESKCVHPYEEEYFLVRPVESSSVGYWYRMRKVGYPGAWIPLVLIRWIHAATAFSDWSHMDMVC